MIHPQELRIGNYVGATYAGNQIPPLTDFEASVFEANGFGIHRIISGADIDNAKDWYFPIPLTEEWLIKFGFERDRNFVLYFNKAKMSISFKENKYNGRVFFNSWAVLEEMPAYVHQLQNLYFALTGSELTIKQ